MNFFHDICKLNIITLFLQKGYKIFFRSNQEGSGAPLIELYDLQSRAWKWSPKMLKIIPKRGKEE